MMLPRQRAFEMGSEGRPLDRQIFVVSQAMPPAGCGDWEKFMRRGRSSQRARRLPAACRGAAHRSGCNETRASDGNRIGNRIRSNDFLRLVVRLAIATKRRRPGSRVELV